MGDWDLGLHTAGGPLALFFREHLLLEETPEARSGTWAPQVRSAALWAVGGAQPSPWVPTAPHTASTLWVTPLSPARLYSLPTLLEI